ASGALDDVSQSSDHIQAELDRTALGSGVEAELAAMKAELGPGQKTLEAHPPEPATLVEEEKKA
ncbi:MAG TPA: PspA/IM30 family protein, partial [Actinomycetota bacterium]